MIKIKREICFILVKRNYTYPKITRAFKDFKVTTYIARVVEQNFDIRAQNTKIKQALTLDT